MRGRDQDRKVGRKEERKGKSHPWAVSASLHASGLLASQSILLNQRFLAPLPLPLYPLLLDFLPSGDSISAVFLCPSSWKNVSRDMELPVREVYVGAGVGFSPCPFSAQACQGSTGTRDWRLSSVPSTSPQPEVRPLLYSSLSSHFSSHSPFL